MNVLDENILENQLQQLKRWRVSVRQIGVDVSRKGIQDDEIIPFLLTLSRPTFFTRDLGFFDHKLRHQRYCLICLAVGRYEAASFTRRVLKHSALDTQAKRMGTVVRASSRGLAIWRLHAEQTDFHAW